LKDLKAEMKPIILWKHLNCGLKIAVFLKSFHHFYGVLGFGVYVVITIKIVKLHPENVSDFYLFFVVFGLNQNILLASCGYTIETVRSVYRFTYIVWKGMRSINYLGE